MGRSASDMFIRGMPRLWVVGVVQFLVYAALDRLCRSRMACGLQVERSGALSLMLVHRHCTLQITVVCENRHSVKRCHRSWRSSSGEVISPHGGNRILRAVATGMSYRRDTGTRGGLTVETRQDRGRRCFIEQLYAAGSWGDL